MAATAARARSMAAAVAATPAAIAAPELAVVFEPFCMFPSCLVRCSECASGFGFGWKCFHFDQTGPGTSDIPGMTMLNVFLG
jgi:hypothetical protein